jgi:hypothetical protein
LFDEVKGMDREQYIGLGLREQLRTLPDLLVADPGLTWAKLIEVKFRRVFTRDTADELVDTITDQRRFWPQSTAVIIIGQPFLEDARFHQDYARVIPPGETGLLKGPRGIDIPSDEGGAMELLWHQLPMLTNFSSFAILSVSVRKAGIGDATFGTAWTSRQPLFVSSVGPNLSFIRI